MTEPTTDKINGHLAGERVTTTYFDPAQRKRIHVPMDQEPPPGAFPMLGTVNSNDVPFGEPGGRAVELKALLISRGCRSKRVSVARRSSRKFTGPALQSWTPSKRSAREHLQTSSAMRYRTSGTVQSRRRLCALHATCARSPIS